MALGIELANVRAIGRGIALEQRHRASESWRALLVRLGLDERLAFG